MYYYLSSMSSFPKEYIRDSKMREFNLILDLVSFVRDSSSAIDFERLAGINFPKYSPARS